MDNSDILKSLRSELEDNQFGLSTQALSNRTGVRPQKIGAVLGHNPNFVKLGNSKGGRSVFILEDELTDEIRKRWVTE